MCHLHNNLKHSVKAFSNHFLHRLKTEEQLERVFLNISIVQAQSSLCIEMKVNTKSLEQLIKNSPEPNVGYHELQTQNLHCYSEDGF